MLSADLRAGSLSELNDRLEVARRGELFLAYRVGRPSRVSEPDPSR